MKLHLKIHEPLATGLAMMAKEAGLEVEKLAEVAIGSVVAGWFQDRLDPLAVPDSGGSYPIVSRDGDMPSS